MWTVKLYTYENAGPEAAVPVELPAPHDVQYAENEHKYSDYYEQPPGARFLVVDLHFLDDDDFRSHGGDPVGGAERCRVVHSACHERRGAHLLRAACRDDPACVRAIAERIDGSGGHLRRAWQVAITSPEQQIAGRWFVLSREQRTPVVVEPDAMVAVDCAGGLRRSAMNMQQKRTRRL